MYVRALAVAFAASLAFPQGASAMPPADVGFSSAPHVDARIASLAPDELAAEVPALEVADLASTVVDTVSEPRRQPSGNDLTWPIENTINTHFGGGHDGIDIEGETGDPVAAAGAGRITFAGDDGDGYGTKIVISHGSEISTLYSHLNEMKVTKGWVEKGDVIGTVGCTGSCSGDHLHFEILRDEVAVDPLDILP